MDPATIDCLNGVAQGNGPTNRIGRKFTMKSILIQGAIHIAAQTNQTALDEAPVVYIALVLDTQTNGVTLNSEDVFTNPVGNGTLAVAPLRNMSNTGRFKVLKSLTMRCERRRRWDQWS